MSRARRNRKHSPALRLADAKWEEQYGVLETTFGREFSRSMESVVVDSNPMWMTQAAPTYSGFNSRCLLYGPVVLAMSIRQKEPSILPLLRASPLLLETTRKSFKEPLLDVEPDIFVSLILEGACKIWVPRHDAVVCMRSLDPN